MLRRMEWRRLARDPRSPLAWWWQEAHLPAGTVALVSVGFVALGALGLAVRSPLMGLLGLLCPLIALALLKAYHHLRQVQALSGLRGLAPVPAPTETFPVEFSLLMGEVCTGRDRGVASVLDGWLHVEGLRTSFSLRPIDTTRIGSVPNGADAFELPGGQRIEVRSLGTAADRATFKETIRVWHRFTFGPPAGEPTLPPLEVHATALVRPLSTLALGVVLFVAALGSALFLLGQPSAFLAVLIPTLFYATQFCGQGFGTLRNLTALDRQARGAAETRILKPPGGA